jgi:RNA polymerase sigma-70 factor (ECF subfamily)
METYQGTGHHDPQPPLVRIDRDSQLLHALRVGEATAADLLVATYGDRAYRLAVRITGSGLDAEEAVQDAFWSVVRKIGTFRGDSSLGSWIYRITTNAAYQKLRSRAPQRDEISMDEILPVFHEDGRHAGPITDWSANIHDAAAQSELRVALASAIGELPAHYRAVIVLRDVEGESIAEVASALGIAIATAKSRVHRARLFLRQRLAMFMSDAAASNVSSNAATPHEWVDRRGGQAVPRRKGKQRKDVLTKARLL